MKQCSKCKLPQSTSNFHAHKLTSDGLQSWCKTCQRLKWEANKDRYSRAKRIARYQKLGIALEPEQLDQTTCAICGKQVRLFVDHCHKTNRFRGMLCQKCNILLGTAEDDIAILKAACRYLRASE